MADFGHLDCLGSWTRADSGVGLMVEVPGSGSQWSPAGGGVWPVFAIGSSLALVPVAAGGAIVGYRLPGHLMFGYSLPLGATWLFKKVTARDRAEHPAPSGHAFIVSLLSLFSGIGSTSSGGGGPGGVLTSAVPPSITSGGAPPSVEGLGRLINSAHGGGRSGAKPRNRCPPGFRWDGRRCVRKG